MITLSTLSATNTSIRIENGNDTANFTCESINFSFYLENINAVTQTADLYLRCSVRGVNGGAGTFTCWFIDMMQIQSTVLPGMSMSLRKITADGIGVGDIVYWTITDDSTKEIVVDISQPSGVPVGSGTSDVLIGTVKFNAIPDCYLAPVRNCLYGFVQRGTFKWYCSEAHGSTTTPSGWPETSISANNSNTLKNLYNDDLYQIADVLPSAPTETANGCVQIYSDGVYSSYYSLVYTNGQWVRTVPHIFSDGEWQPATNLQ